MSYQRENNVEMLVWISFGPTNVVTAKNILIISEMDALEVPKEFAVFI